MAENSFLHNIDLIKRDLEYLQVGNSSVFIKNSKYLLSPAVSEGKNGSYWVDIRQANLDQIPDRTKCDFLIRIVPDMFCLFQLSSINNLLSLTLMDNRPHSGVVWGIKLEIKKFKRLLRSETTGI